jgi:hypothetical protein
MNQKQKLRFAVVGVALITTLAWAQGTSPAKTPVPPSPAAQAKKPAKPPEPLDLTPAPGEAEMPEEEEKNVTFEAFIDTAPGAAVSIGGGGLGQIEAGKGRIAVAQAGLAKQADELRVISRDLARAQVDATKARVFWNSPQGTGSRTFVLPTSGLAGDDLKQAHEDLTVMSRIFGKAASKSGKNQREFAFRFAEQRDLEAMYLEGFGAMFFVSVDWPVADPGKPEVKKAEPKNENDAVWEREKRRLQGEDDDEGHETDFDGPTGPAYDAGRVSMLKERLAGVYKHASNLRVVKPNEEVVVVVLGPGDSRDRKLRMEGVPGGPAANILNISQPGNTTLVLRAKKGDIDKLASSKSSDSDFAKIIRYDGTPGILANGSGSKVTKRVF